jgi:hypothetical protein
MRTVEIDGKRQDARPVSQRTTEGRPYRVDREECSRSLISCLGRARARATRTTAEAG